MQDPSRTTRAIIPTNPTEAYSLYGEEGEAFVVSVVAVNDAWEVLVHPVDNPHGSVERTAKEFSTLQATLQAAQARMSLPLPHFPLEPNPNTQTAALQRYMEQLVQVPEVLLLPAFVQFVQPPAGELTHAPSLKRVGSEPAVVRNTSAETRVCTSVRLVWSDASGEHEAELPVLTPSHGMGNPCIDVRALGAMTGFFTHDPGFQSTSSCVSAITFIDGEKGVLLHRGYPIRALAESCSFPEVAYLLLEGELPNREQLSQFRRELHANQLVHEKLITFFGGFKSDAHPMAIMVGVVGALSAFYPEAMNIGDAETRRMSAIRLMAKMPTIAAISYKTAIGEPVVYPRSSLSFAANFLHMMHATPCEECAARPAGPSCLTTPARLCDVPAHVRALGTCGVHSRLPCALRATLAQTSSIQCTRRPWKRSSSSMRITSKTPRRQLCASLAPRRPTRLRVLRRALPHCGGPRTVAPTRLFSRCSRRLARRSASRSILPKPRTRPTHSG